MTDLNRIERQALALRLHDPPLVNVLGGVSSRRARSSGRSTISWTPITRASPGSRCKPMRDAITEQGIQQVRRRWARVQRRAKQARPR
ncbi:MAG: hypothetical protein E6J90_03790 [Deltaproteobacteria bacterium]|nr:MAG: hypothetical protein E6J90_03790 [Deltaproteobacteria bacterium]